MNQQRKAQAQYQGGLIDACASQTADKCPQYVKSNLNLNLTDSIDCVNPFNLQKNRLAR